VTPELARAAAALDRRGFLRLVGTAAATGLLPTGCRDATPAPPAGVELRVLTPRTWATFTAATARLVGPKGAALVTHEIVVPGRAADALLAANASLARPLTEALWILELGVWPLVRKVRPFTRITPGAQDLVLRDLEHSRLTFKRDLFAGLRSLAFIAFYGDPGARRLTGYPGPGGDGQVTIADGMASAADLV
jgi:hypothetical protein